MKIQSPKTLRRNQQQRSLPDPVAPSEPYDVDVVVPFWSGDAHWLGECIDGLLNQNHCTPIIHVIADSCEFPPLPALQNTSAEIIRYRTNKPAGRGPYRLTNALVRHGHCRTDYLALQDADDISLPDRMWRQISLMQQTGAGMISSAMENFTATAAMDDRQKWEPIILPGRIYSTVPRGRCVNSMRTVRIEVFRRLNGFANMACTGDFDFDNRCAFSGVKIHHDMTVLGRRRLHESSLSHGVAPMKSALRQRDIQALQRHLDRVRACRVCGKTFGALQTAFELEVV